VYDAIQPPICTREAFDYTGEGHAKGKIIINV
jgi:hypothetical protein